MNVKRELNKLLLSLFFINLLASCALQPDEFPTYNSRAGSTITIILTRHGDRDLLSSVLNDQGLARAQALADEIGDMNITAIYSPDLLRNINTARPLAKRLGVEINIVPDTSSPEDIIEMIQLKHSGEVVLWVGNTSNLPQIYFKLGGQGRPPKNYGDLFILKVKDKGPPEITRKHYGAND